MNPRTGAAIPLLARAACGLVLVVAFAACQRQPTPVEAMCSALSDTRSALDQLTLLGPASAAVGYGDAEETLATALSSVEAAAPGPWCCALPLEVPARARAIEQASASYYSTVENVRSDLVPHARAGEVITATESIRSAVDALEDELRCGSTVD